MKKVILIVEDDTLLAEVLKRFLASEQVQVERAESGEEALSVLSRKQIDLVLTDYAMPGMNGVSLTEAVKRLDSSFRIIGMSGQDVAVPFLKAGADRFLKKPFGKQEILKTLSPFL